MKLLRQLVFAVLLAASATAEPVRDHMVVLISVDGLASYFHDDPKANLPTIRKLAA